MELNYHKPIDIVENISTETFKQNYLLPEKPVVLKKYFTQFPAYQKWTIDFFKEKIGNETVGVFHEGKNQNDRSFKRPHLKMKFSDYLDEIISGPSNLRLFLFNPFRNNPELKKDFWYPDLTSRFIKHLPFMFFGGEGSVVRVHQDMDWSNVFLTQLHGRKKVILFSPEYSRILYRFPFNVHSPVDILNPNYGEYPGLQFVEGMQCILEPGDTLFIPSGYWHHITYLEGGYAVNWRSLSPHNARIFKGIWYVVILSNLDDLFRKIFGSRWFNLKRNLANSRANEYINKLKLAQ